MHPAFQPARRCAQGFWSGHREGQEFWSAGGKNYRLSALLRSTQLFRATRRRQELNAEPALKVRRQHRAINHLRQKRGERNANYSKCLAEEKRETKKQHH